MEQLYKNLLKEIGEDKFGNSRIVLSRIAPQLISELFKKEGVAVAVHQSGQTQTGYSLHGR